MGAITSMAAAALGATTATTVVTRATRGMILRARILSLYHCLCRLMIITKKTRGLSRATRLCGLPPGGAQAPL
jgi:hypothetical protein